MNPLELVDKKYISNVFIKVALLIIVGNAIAAAALYLAVHEGIGGGYAGALHSMKELRDVLTVKTLLVFSGMGVLIVTGVAVLNLLYSHRVAGPLYRLGVEAGRIGEGDFSSDVKLRETDAIFPLADEVNRLTANYRGRIASLLQKCEDLEALRLSNEDLSARKSDHLNIEASVRAIKMKAKEIERMIPETEE